MCDAACAVYELRGSSRAIVGGIKHTMDLRGGLVVLMLPQPWEGSCQLRGARFSTGLAPPSPPERPCACLRTPGLRTEASTACRHDYIVDRTRMHSSLYIIVQRPAVLRRPVCPRLALHKIHTLIAAHGTLISTLTGRAPIEHHDASHACPPIQH